MANWRARNSSQSGLYIETDPSFATLSFFVSWHRHSLEESISHYYLYTYLFLVKKIHNSLPIATWDTVSDKKFPLILQAYAIHCIIIFKIQHNNYGYVSYLSKFDHLPEFLEQVKEGTVITYIQVKNFNM